MAKIKKQAAIEQLQINAQELRDVVEECDEAIKNAEANTVIVLIDTEFEEVEYFVPKEYIIAAFQKWREDTCLRQEAIYQKLEGLA